MILDAAAIVIIARWGTLQLVCLRGRLYPPSTRPLVYRARIALAMICNKSILSPGCQDKVYRRRSIPMARLNRDDTINDCDTEELCF
jgi:hypothetical protein